MNIDHRITVINCWRILDNHAHQSVTLNVLSVMRTIDNFIYNDYLYGLPNLSTVKQEFK